MSISDQQLYFSTFFYDYLLRPFTLKSTPILSALLQDFWLEEQLRLKTLLLATPSSCSVPLVILVPHALTDHQFGTVSRKLGLGEVLVDGLVSYGHVVAMETTVEEPEATRTVSWVDSGVLIIIMKAFLKRHVSG